MQPDGDGGDRGTGAAFGAAQREPGSRSGFQGAVGAVALVDMLQVWGLNRLSGLVTVSCQGRSGRLYFLEGEIVHAEAEGLSGEAAAALVIGWPEGAFDLAPNTTTLKRTIQKRLSHLLLDAHRELDEQRRATPPPAPAPADPPRRTALDEIRALRGVTGVVRFGRDGRPVGEAGPAAEALAAKGLYLAMTHAAAVAASFGLHELALATLHGARESFVLAHASGNHLCVGVADGVAVEPVAAQVRALLVRPGR